MIKTKIPLITALPVAAEWKQKFEPPNQTRDCEHGNLARSCHICELEHEVFNVKCERDTLTAQLAVAMDANHRANLAIGNQADENDKIVSNLTAQLAVARGVLEKILPSLICAFSEQQNLPACDSYANPYENWCGICKRRKRISDALTTITPPRKD